MPMPSLFRSRWWMPAVAGFAYILGIALLRWRS
jgi:hypothetical protein